MLDTYEPQLQLVTDNPESVTPLVQAVMHYCQEIHERRRRLTEDLGYFEAKIADLEQLDPLDFTGLKKIYQDHAGHIRGLIAEIDRNN